MGELISYFKLIDNNYLNVSKFLFHGYLCIIPLVIATA